MSREADRIERLLRGPARSIRQAVVHGDVSAEHIASECVRVIEEGDRWLHSFLTIDRKGALAQARALDQKLEASARPGPLFGVPVSLKDNLETAGIRTTGGSLLFKEHIPEQDSSMAHRLRGADAIIVGKTNTPEFAASLQTRNRLMPPTANPTCPGRSPGGSSGGAAASVASNFTPLAVGTDGAGSVRLPAAWCGIVGMLPTVGTVSRSGALFATRRFSSPGPLARNVADCALLLSVMRTRKLDDETLTSRGSKIRLNRIVQNGLVQPDPAILAVFDSALAELLDAGLTVIDSSECLHADRSLEPLIRIMMFDRYNSLGAADFTPEQWRDLESDTAAYLAAASRVTRREYAEALDERDATRRRLQNLFGNAEAIITPTVPFEPPPMSAWAGSSGGTRARETRATYLAYTHPFNFAGFPAMSIPCNSANGTPVGLQVVGKPGCDSLVLAICALAESVLQRGDVGST